MLSFHRSERTWRAQGSTRLGPFGQRTPGSGCCSCSHPRGYTYFQLQITYSVWMVYSRGTRAFVSQHGGDEFESRSLHLKPETKSEERGLSGCRKGLKTVPLAQALLSQKHAQTNIFCFPTGSHPYPQIFLPSIASQSAQLSHVVTCSHGGKFRQGSSPRYVPGLQGSFFFLCESGPHCLLQSVHSANK